ncbi:class I SAM-dependent methyltransferase [Thermodesulfobacteriota bacterium]
MSTSENMDIELIREVNRLWSPIYLGIARQVASHMRVTPQEILEIGCFSGGIGLTLLTLFPSCSLTVALDNEELAHTFGLDWIDLTGKTDPPRIRSVHTPLVPLDIPDDSHELVICRGIFFFLDPEGVLLREIDRVIKPGGLAFVGGGYGTDTPQDFIDLIADESRSLNQALGKQFVSKEQFRAALDSAGLTDRSYIVEEGGLWAVIRK